MAKVELKKLRKKLAAVRTGWFDTHPSDAERIKRAAREETDGIFHSDLPGEAVFQRFDQLCQSLLKV